MEQPSAGEVVGSGLSPEGKLSCGNLRFSANRAVLRR